MDWINIEKKSGYSIWHNSDGEQYVVIEGLSPDQIHTPGILESFLTEHYDILAITYWVILAVTFGYLFVRHIFMPLRQRKLQGKPLLSDD